jgi:hypothetical protein
LPGQASASRSHRSKKICSLHKSEVSDMKHDYDELFAIIKNSYQELTSSVSASYKHLAVFRPKKKFHRQNFHIKPKKCAKWYTHLDKKKIRMQMLNFRVLVPDYNCAFIPLLSLFYRT